jgi:hypothetical protein
VPKSRLRAIGTTGTVGVVLFLDEAYDLEPASSAEGRTIMAEIMSAAEDHSENVSIIIAGYKDDIENKLYSSNPSMASRFKSIHFEDFDLEQLGGIWSSLCKDRGYSCTHEAQTVATRRLFRSSKTKGFGNARSVRKMVEQTIADAKARVLLPDAKLPTITIEDVIGPEPSEKSNAAIASVFRSVEAMIGLETVKKELRQILEVVQNNWNEERKGHEPKKNRSESRHDRQSRDW